MKKLNQSKIDLQVQNWEDAISLADKILEVLKAFDGKKITKRIDAKLKEVHPNLHMRKDSITNDWEIYLYYKQRYDCNSGSYLKETNYQYAWCIRNSELNYKDAEERILGRVERTKESISQLKKQIAELDSILEQRQKLITELNVIHQEIHYLIKDELDLDTHLFWK